MVTEKAEMSFLEHLGVLRGHLIRSVYRDIYFYSFSIFKQKFSL